MRLFHAAAATPHSKESVGLWRRDTIRRSTSSLPLPSEDRLSRATLLPTWLAALSMLVLATLSSSFTGGACSDCASSSIPGCTDSESIILGELLGHQILRN